MFEEKLVEAVRENTILFDLKHPNYKRTDIKNKIWMEIAVTLNSTDMICKTKWKSLRDTFKRNRRMEPSGSAGGEASLKKKWKHMELLSFLNKVEDERETVGNYETENKENESLDLDSPEGSCSTDEVLSDVRSQQPPKRRKTLSESSFAKDEFCEFLNSASKALSNVENTIHLNQEISTTTMIFSALAKKIERANLSPKIVRMAENKVAAIVDDILNMYEN